MNRVFIIPGWTYNLDKWTYCLAQLRAQGIDAVVLPVPGLTAPSDKVWDIDGYVKWLGEQLKGIPKPTVLGHSNGGRITLAYAQANPGRIGQLILLDAAGVPHEQLLRRMKLGILRSISLLGKPVRRVPLLRKVFYRLIGAADYNQAPDNMKRTMRNMLAANKTIRFQDIDTPTTLIWGSQDEQTPLRDGKFMAKTMPHASLHVIKGARHAPQATHTDQVVAIIKDALGDKT